MSGEVFVSLADLRRALAQSLDEIERQRGPVIDLGADFYWTVGPWDAFRFVAEAPQPTGGQLTDDVQSMQKCSPTKRIHRPPFGMTWHI